MGGPDDNLNSTISILRLVSHLQILDDQGEGRGYGKSKMARTLMRPKLLIPSSDTIPRFQIRDLTTLIFLPDPFLSSLPFTRTSSCLESNPFTNTRWGCTVRETTHNPIRPLILCPWQEFLESTTSPSMTTPDWPDIQHVPQGMVSVRVSNRRHAGTCLNKHFAEGKVCFNNIENTKTHHGSKGGNMWVKSSWMSSEWVPVPLGFVEQVHVGSRVVWHPSTHNWLTRSQRNKILLLLQLELSDNTPNLLHYK